MKVGDIVGRKSYRYDVLFKIVAITQGDRPQAYLKGVNKRLYATAELSDLSVMKEERIGEEAKANSTQLQLLATTLNKQKSVMAEKSLRWRRADVRHKPRFGTVVHLDGDEDYCRQAQSFYEKLAVQATCTFALESEQESLVPIVLKAYQPDILVLTGHDGMLRSRVEEGNYHTSRFFSLAIKRARRLRPARDDLLVIAGACQSNYQLLMSSGANFASSPGRVLIDVYDPCLVAVQMALLPIGEYIDPQEAIKSTSMTGRGMGGLESQGKMRMCYPEEEM